MKTNVKYVIGVLVVLVAVSVAGYLVFFRKPSLGCGNGPERKVGSQTITGKFTIVDEKCDADVDGMPVYAFAGKCAEAKQYENKTVKITADVYQNASDPGLKCESVNHINNIDVIELVEATEQPGQPTTESPIVFTQYPLAKDASVTVSAANQFAFELYSQYKNTNDNVFFSPYSISSALEMTYEGAKGKTASEMQSVFHFATDAATRIPSFAKLFSQINPQNATYQLSTANALWAQKSYPFDANYIKTVETYYGGKSTNLDFVGDTEGSRQTINSWVSSKTNAKIPELFAKGTLDETTRLVLTNAVYFKGKWDAPFEKGLTQQKDFTTVTSSKVKCSMMNKESDFGYAETPDYQAIEMPYEKKDLSMVVVLPKSEKMGSVEKIISDNEFTKIKNSFNSELVNVYLPKFKFDTSYRMNDTLSKMGMPTAFDQDNADFTGMYDKSQANNENLYIGIVVHKAYVDVNEEGTEAAAATGVGMFANTAVEAPTQPKLFNADHPFIFAIVHNATGDILFLGKVNDPTK